MRSMVLKMCIDWVLVMIELEIGILRKFENSLQIVFQFDHQDLMTRAQDLGLLPVKN